MAQSRQPSALKRAEPPAPAQQQVRPPKKKKTWNRALPKKIEAYVPEARYYVELQEFEKRLDATIVRKKLDIQEGSVKPIKMKKTLRIVVSNETSNQAHDQENDMNDDDATVKIPSWKLKVQGKLLDVRFKVTANSNSLTHKSIQTPEDQLSMLPKFTHFVKSIKIELQRDPNLYPEGNVIEWRKGSSAHSFDVFEVKRQGDQEVPVSIEIVMENNPEKLRVSARLAEVLDVYVDTQQNILMRLWQYIKMNGLQDVEHKTYINFDAQLTDIFRTRRAMFTQLPDLLSQNTYAPPPIKINYTIKVDKELTVSETAYEVPVEIEDPIKAKVNSILAGGNLAMLKEIGTLDEQIARHVEEITNCKMKRDFMLAFAADPANFVQRWTASQARDLEVILGDSRINVEEARRSSFNDQEWIREAVFLYLQSSKQR
ncbi:SWI/SNF complex component snf12 [Chytridiales sp. JEL 0842]|nr:SWI/SNF complex component snf12 [Chytridiales sp. JEL 0842]